MSLAIQVLNVEDLARDLRIPDLAVRLRTRGLTVFQYEQALVTPRAEWESFHRDVILAATSPVMVNGSGTPPTRPTEISADDPIDSGWAPEAERLLRHNPGTARLMRDFLSELSEHWPEAVIEPHRWTRTIVLPG